MILQTHHQTPNQSMEMLNVKRHLNLDPKRHPTTTTYN